jgi:hypothetical protein
LGLASSPPAGTRTKDGLTLPAGDSTPPLAPPPAGRRTETFAPDIAGIPVHAFADRVAGLSGGSRSHSHQHNYGPDDVVGDVAAASGLDGPSAADASVASITSRGHHDSGVWLERHLRELDDLEARLAESNKQAGTPQRFAEDSNPQGGSGHEAASPPSAREAGIFRQSRRALRFDV